MTDRHDGRAPDGSVTRRRVGVRGDVVPLVPRRDQVGSHWTLEPFVADDGTIPFERFIDELSDFQFVALAAALERVLAVRGIELVRTEWLKPLGDGLHEFRLRHDAAEVIRMFGGPASAAAPHRGRVLLRVFVHFHGARVILLLGGYDKGQYPKERHQQREIGKARRLLSQFKARRRQERRR